MQRNRRKRAERYVLRTDPRTRRLAPIPHHLSTGTYFSLYADQNDGLWYWRLVQRSSPHKAIAQSGLGYKNYWNAVDSIPKAYASMIEVAKE